jgi:hypothetical protein
MNAPTKVAGFIAGLAGVFGLALAVGTQVGPIAEPAEAHSTEHGTDHGDDHATDEAEGASTTDLPGGLMTSQAGYTLVLTSTEAQPGRAQPISFVIEGPDGIPVTEYDAEHDKLLHLIVVRRDFTGFQHVHPELSPDGTWTAAADLNAGQWRVFADFVPTGADGLTLGADLAVPGQVAQASLAPEARTSIVDGYTVTLKGELVAGEHSMLTLSVAKDDHPVTDLEPYLGAYGHLVALREGDLAYLHVHPGGEPGDGETEPGPDIEFGAEVPSGGGYHLYLDFKHDGVVRTAQFALEATGASGDHDETGTS